MAKTYVSVQWRERKTMDFGPGWMMMNRELFYFRWPFRRVPSAKMRQWLYEGLGRLSINFGVYHRER